LLENKKKIDVDPTTYMKIVESLKNIEREANARERWIKRAEKPRTQKKNAELRKKEEEKVLTKKELEDTKRRRRIPRKPPRPLPRT
jgi:hypothetical protein